MSEREERFKAIGKIADLLRESTVKKIAFDQNTLESKVVYENVVFNEREHQDLKRAFLKLCQEI